MDNLLAAERSVLRAAGQLVAEGALRKACGRPIGIRLQSTEPFR